MLKLILLLHRRQDMSVEDFRRYARETHAPLLRQLPGLRRLVFNFGLSDETGGAPAVDCVAEDWFESSEAMQLAFSSPAGEAVAADAPNFLDVTQMQMVVVEEDELELAS